MAVKKKKESLADQIINGTYEPKFSAKNVIQKRDSIVDRVQQRLNNTSNNVSTNIADRVQLKNNITSEQNLSMSDKMKKMASAYGKTYEINNTNNNSNNSIPSMWSKVVKRMGDTVQNYSERAPHLVKADKQKIIQSKKVNETNKIDRTLPVLIQSMQRKQNKNKNENEIDLSKIATPTLDQLNIRNNNLSSNSNLKLTNKKEEKTWGDKLVEAGKDPELLGNQITTSVKKTGASVPYSLLTQATQGYGDNHVLKNSALYTDFKQGSYGEFEQKMKLQNAKMHGLKESNIEKTRQNLKKYINEQNTQIQENINNASNEISKKLLELTPSMVQSGIGAGITAGATALGGAGIGQAIGTAFFSETAFADYYDDAIERGLTGAKANKYATAMAFWEGASEEFITSERLIPSQTMKAFLGGVGKDVVENFAQEALTDPLQEILAKASGGDYDIENLKENMIRDGFDGALTSLIMFGATNGIPSSINIAQKLRNGENITPNELKTAWKDLEKVEGKEVIEAQMENGIQSTINEMLQRAKQKLDGVSRKNVIENSNLSDELKASLLRVAEKHNMSTEEVQNLINNPPNEQVLQNNQQIIQEQSKTAQNGNMGQTEQSIQNYLKNASENGADVQNKTVKSIYEVTQRRGIVAEYNADVFKDKNGKVDENKNAVWTTDENGNRKILINPNANTETTLQNIMVHELTHDFEGSKEYEALSKLALDKMKTQEGYLEARKDLERIYSQVYDKNSKEFQTLVDQEAVANFLGENLGNQEFINELANSQPRTTIQKIYDWVVDKIAKVTGNEKLYWKNVEQKFKNAYNSQNENSSQDSKYSIAGRKAMNNAIKQNSQYKVIENNYNKALQMANQKIDNEKIRQATNWFQDKNGDWKFRFTDKDMELKKEVNHILINKKYDLEDIVKHDLLFMLYPELSKNNPDYQIKVEFRKMNDTKRGSYSDKYKVIGINSKILNIENAQRYIEETLIHEIQHVIQHIEGFEVGASMKSGIEKYKNSLGEIEAKDTEDTFYREKYLKKDVKKSPESSKKNPKPLDLKKQNIFDRILSSLNNFFEEESVNYEETMESLKEMEKRNRTDDRSLVVGRVNENNVENSNKSSFSMEEINSKVNSDNNINKLNEDGITMTYVRMLNQNTQNYGATYGQNIEPAGEYMSMDTMKGKYKVPGAEYGTIHFNNPLILDHINTTENGWKKTLSEMFDNKTGEKLSNAIKKSGYDAIITIDEDGNYNEIVNLNGTKNENSEKGSFSMPKLKEKQLEIINKSNHMLDDYHLGIRSIEDIKTFDEVINDDESFVYGDFSKEDAEKALEKGTVTVYSSKPIEQGSFVSTSKNMAQDYAGRNGKVYSQEVSLNDVAWINGDEGQYAKVDNIKYSYQSNGAWNDFLKKHSINKGTGETMQQVKLPQMLIEQFQKVLDTAQHIPQEEKEYLLETVKDIKRNKTSLEDFKNTIETMEKAYDEQNENILDTKKTYNTGRREIYQKYMKAKGEYDTSSLDNAKEIIPANKQGRRTKTQWLNIAKQIGTEIADKSNAEIEEIAYRTWQDERPSNKESLNRQGEKFVTFTSDEWINTIYDTVKEQREKYSIDTDKNKGINYFDEDLQAIREASEKGLGDTMTVDEQIEAIQNLDSKELDNTLPDTSSKIVDKLSKEKTPFKQRVAEVRRLITNKGAFVDDLFKATGNKQGIWKYDRYLGSFSEGQVSIGVRQINSDGVVVGDSLLDIYDNAKKEGITQKILDDYVLNKDNISRSKYEKYIFGEEISARDSQRIIDEYDKKYPQLKEYAKQVSDYADNNTKGYLVGTFISQDLHNKLRQMYPDHVPVVRDISETPGLAEYDNVGAQVLKRATGGNQEILSPKEALAQQSVSYARAFRRNEALKEVYKSLKSDTKVLYDLGQIIDMEQANDCIKKAISYDDVLKKYTATIFENGEAKVFEISKDIFDAFNNDTLFDKIDRGLEKSLLGKALKKSTETFKGLTTGKNILYALKNMARDINDAPINSTTNFANYMRDWAYAYEQIVSNGKYYKEYVNAGGNSNTFYDYSKGLIKKDFSSLPKKAINFINNQTIGRVEQINEVVETAPRLAEYIATRQRGGSIDEALYNSAEVTTNFKRGGELSKLVDKYGVPYLNASIQGLSKVYRNVSEAKGFKQYAKLAVNATLAGVLPSVINHLVYDDDDDYEELPDYIKDGYYLIKVTDLPNGLQNKLKKWTENNFVRIPKGRISAVLGGTAVRLHETLNEEGEDVWNGYMSDVVLNNIGINNPYTNNLFTPLLKQAMNNEAWYGGSIYSESKYKNKLPVEITDEKTTQLSNWIAETVYNMVGKEKYKQLVDKENGNAFFKVLATPKLLDYAMDQYSGIVGDIVMPMLTPYAENNALVDQFTTSSTLKSSTVSKFYEILGNCYQNSEYATDTDKLTYKYLEEVSKEVGGMYAEKSSIQSDSTLTNKQKQQKTYEIQEQINQKMEEAINSVENMKLTNNTANFNGTEYYKDEEGKWKEVTEKNKIEGLSTETYADYKSKLNKATELKRETEGKENAQLNDAEKIELINNSTYTDKEKDIIYSNNINKDDKTYNSLKLINNNDLDKVEEYLKYHQKQLNGDFNNDKEDDGTKNGKSIRNSGEAKMVNYLNESNFDELESLYLHGRTFKLNSSERTRFARLLNEKELTEEEIKQIYLTLNGVVEMKDGSIKWK